ncbi:MAG TPA: hypothetical protein VKU01_23650 [Bryobacteraceae bacterium]|nr:hypothetical protein [Bryobacteraceae bacterium]
MRLLGGTVTLAFLVSAYASADQTSYTIAGFDAPNALQNWHSEAGELTVGPGRHNQGAVLTYRGAAAAIWRPTARLPKFHHPAISLWIRVPPEVEAAIVTKSMSGESQRMPIAATIEHPNANDWQYAVLPLTGKSQHLSELQILVQPRIAGPVHGTVAFDDIRLLDSDPSFLIDPAAPAAPPPAVPEPQFRLGVNIHRLRDNASLDAARAAGFTFVRADLLWRNVERRGGFRFFAYDALLRALDARGMGVLWILDYGHPDHGGNVPRTPDDIAAFGRFAEAAGAHFKGRNVRYEIWNEPDTIQFWDPEPNPAEYGALLRESVAAIHRADPTASITSGGVSRFDLPFLSRVLDPASAAGLAAIGIHPYPKAPENIVPALQLSREWASSALGDRIEIWDTESGYSSTSIGRMSQASLAVRELLTIQSVGFRLAVWYDLRDDGSDASNPEQNYGLLDSTGAAKPAMQAIRNLIAMTKDRKCIGLLEETPSGTHAMRWEGAAETLLVVWTEDRQTVEFSKQNLVSVRDLFGEPIRTKDRPSHRVRVELAAEAGPIYLLWTR